MAENDREWLDPEHTAKLLEQMRAKIARGGFGVTLQQDPNGAWGTMGATYLTLRFTDEGGDNIEISAVVRGVSSDRAERRARYDRECPQ